MPLYATAMVVNWPCHGEPALGTMGTIIFAGIMVLILGLAGVCVWACRRYLRPPVEWWR